MIETTGERRGAPGADPAGGVGSVPVAAPGRIARGSASPPAELVLTVPADPARLTPLRRGVVGWARDLGADDATLADLQLAVGEAAANAVEHAYPDGPGGRDAVVEVALWQLPSGRAHGGQVIAVRVRDGGRGLAMIRAVAADVVVRPGSTGTEVAFEVPFVAAS